MTEVRVPRIEVRVAAAPDPFALRAAVAARLAGRPWHPGAEASVADAVAGAVEGSRPCS